MGAAGAETVLPGAGAAEAPGAPETRLAAGVLEGTAAIGQSFWVLVFQEAKIPVVEIESAALVRSSRAADQLFHVGEWLAAGNSMAKAGPVEV